MTRLEFKALIRSLQALIKTGNLEEVEKIFEEILGEDENKKGDD